MTKIELEIHDDVIKIINKIQNINDTGVDLNIPYGSVLFENILNLKLLKQQVEKLGKEVQFETEDDIGNNMLAMLDEDKQPVLHTPVTPKKKLQLPAFKLPSIKKPSIPKFKGNVVTVLGLLLGILLIGGYIFVGKTLPIASAKIVVNSQPLIRSITIKVSANTSTSVEDKTLEGQQVSTITVEKTTIETTGEKLEGEKAQGNIKIFNKTTSEKKFEKGEEVILKDDDDLKYELKEDITVPARTEDIVLGTITPGSAVVEVKAKDIGDDYNIDKDDAFKFDDHSEDDYSAVADSDFGGGSSKTVQVVSQDDLDKALLDVEILAEENALKALKTATKSSQTLIEGSEIISATKNEYDKKLGEEASEVTLEQTHSATGLTYKKEELEKLIDDLVKDFVPEGFELSEKDREINTEILGNTGQTVLNATNADVQVTLKAFVEPTIEEEEIKTQLLGTNAEEASRILSGIRNIKNYEFNIEPALPFFRKTPKNTDQISIEIIRQ